MSDVVVVPTQCVVVGLKFTADSTGASGVAYGQVFQYNQGYLLFLHKLFLVLFIFILIFLFTNPELLVLLKMELIFLESLLVAQILVALSVPILEKENMGEIVPLYLLEPPKIKKL